MKQDYIKTIREKCIAANPEITDLKFGCEFTYPRYEKCTVIGQQLGQYRVWCEFRDEASLGTMSKEELMYTEFSEILGRPIRLADVLIALNEPGKRGNRWNKNLYINIDGGFAFTSAGTDCHDYECSWDLKNDSLEHQSEKTLGFIANIFDL